MNKNDDYLPPRFEIQEDPLFQVLDKYRYKYLLNKFESIKFLSQESKGRFQEFYDSCLILIRETTNDNLANKIEFLYSLINTKLEAIESVLHTCKLLMLPNHQQNKLKELLEDKIQEIIRAH